MSSQGEKTDGDAAAPPRGEVARGNRVTARANTEMLAGTRENAQLYAVTRKDLVKLAAKYAEQQRVAVRNVRREAMEDLKKAEKDGVISQDELKRMETEVQGFTDAAVKRIDETLKTKEQEIMQV